MSDGHFRARMHFRSALDGDLVVCVDVSHRSNAIEVMYEIQCALALKGYELVTWHEDRPPMTEVRA